MSSKHDDNIEALLRDYGTAFRAEAGDVFSDRKRRLIQAALRAPKPSFLQNLNRWFEALSSGKAAISAAAFAALVLVFTQNWNRPISQDSGQKTNSLPAGVSTDQNQAGEISTSARPENDDDNAASTADFGEELAMNELNGAFTPPDDFNFDEAGAVGPAVVEDSEQSIQTVTDENKLDLENDDIDESSDIEEYFFDDNQAV